MAQRLKIETQKTVECGMPRRSLECFFLSNLEKDSGSKQLQVGNWFEIYVYWFNACSGFPLTAS